MFLDNYVKSHSLSAEIVGADRILIPRRIAIYICRELGGYALPEIAKTMGGVSYKTVASAISRVRANSSQLKLANALLTDLKLDLKTILGKQTGGVD